jgi:mevalonate kinase
LCVATARWFSAVKLLESQSVYHFAKELENLFHGQSSGLDIAGVASTSGMYFKQGHYAPIQQTWQPHWSLSSCGQIGMTSHCISQVQSLWKENVSSAKKIDKNMANAVKKAKIALETNSPKALQQLASAINTAAQCFQQWGLVSDRLEEHMQTLRDAGALAVKPTGSGGGGYVLSLWDNTPPDGLSIENQLLNE